MDLPGDGVVLKADHVTLKSLLDFSALLLLSNKWK